MQILDPCLSPLLHITLPHRTWLGWTSHVLRGRDDFTARDQEFQGRQTVAEESIDLQAQPCVLGINT